MVDRLHIVISGLVQGVGFRYSVARQANALGLRGWVRNLPDGRVECEFEGPRADLDQIEAWCREGPAFANVSGIESRWEQGEPQHRDFRIRG
jgi:acylphosphatase